LGISSQLRALTIAIGTVAAGVSTMASSVSPASGARPRPLVTRVAVIPPTFHVAATRRDAPGRVSGAILRYVLVRPARISVVILQRGAGVRSARHGCLATHRRTGDFRCESLTVIGRLALFGHAGVNRVRFSGRLRNHSLAPGFYLLHVVRAGGQGQDASFRVLPIHVLPSSTPDGGVPGTSPPGNPPTTSPSPPGSSPPGSPQSCAPYPSFDASSAPSEATQLTGGAYDIGGPPPPPGWCGPPPQLQAATVFVRDGATEALVASEQVAKGQAFAISVAPGTYNVTATKPDGGGCAFPHNPVRVDEHKTVTANLSCPIG